MDASSQRVLLAGASGGIGGALLRELQHAGACVLLVGRNDERLRELAQSLPASQRLGWLVADLRDPASLAGLTARAESERINTLVNLFGVNHFGLFDEQNPADIDLVLETNLVAPVALTRALLPFLLRADAGLVVNVGSIFGALGHAGYAAYCASKFGLRGFSEALHRELSDTAVDVVHVAPRATATSMSERAGRSLNAALGTTEDSVERVAAQIMQAMNRRCPRSSLGWPEKFFARLNQVLPGLVDNALRSKLPVIKAHAESSTNSERTDVRERTKQHLNQKRECLHELSN